MFTEFIKRVKKIASSVWLFFLDLVFPIECLGCGLEGNWLCQACFKNIGLKDKQYCLHCKRENDFGEFCPACRINYDLDGILIASLYEDKVISQSVKALKYHFVRGLAEDLGRLLILFLDNLKKPNRFDLTKADNLVIPVPLSKRRCRWRGFNQAEILGKIFADKFNLEMNINDLIRVKHRKPQAKLDEASRLKNTQGCFRWQGGDLKKKNIILIDDVVTTGATLNECAKVLKANGAAKVWGLVVAKG